MNKLNVLLLLFSSIWSPVQPITRTVQIENASRAQFVMPIQGMNGCALYTLTCYGSESQPDSNNFIYDGDFECRLTEINGQNSRFSNLLTENLHQSRDWQSRARFFGSELQGACGEIPEFGRARNFLLRGMRISMQISNPTFTPQKSLLSFAFTVSVNNDSNSSAQGAIAYSPTIDQHWKTSPCKLDNSVIPNFKRKK